jgi:hypothetical protein
MWTRPSQMCRCPCWASTCRFRLLICMKKFESVG